MSDKSTAADTPARYRWATYFIAVLLVIAIVAVAWIVYDPDQSKILTQQQRAGLSQIAWSAYTPGEIDRILSRYSAAQRREIARALMPAKDLHRCITGLPTERSRKLFPSPWPPQGDPWDKSMALFKWYNSQSTRIEYNELVAGYGAPHAIVERSELLNRLDNSSPSKELTSLLSSYEVNSYVELIEKRLPPSEATSDDVVIYLYDMFLEFPHAVQWPWFGMCYIYYVDDRGRISHSPVVRWLPGRFDYPESGSNKRK